MGYASRPCRGEARPLHPTAPKQGSDHGPFRTCAPPRRNRRLRPNHPHLPARLRGDDRARCKYHRRGGARVRTGPRRRHRRPDPGHTGAMRGLRGRADRRGSGDAGPGAGAACPVRVPNPVHRAGVPGLAPRLRCSDRLPRPAPRSHPGRETDPLWCDPRGLASGGRIRERRRDHRGRTTRPGRRVPALGRPPHVLWHCGGARLAALRGMGRRGHVLSSRRGACGPRRRRFLRPGPLARRALDGHGGRQGSRPAGVTGAHRAESSLRPMDSGSRVHEGHTLWMSNGGFVRPVPPSNACMLEPLEHDHCTMTGSIHAVARTTACTISDATGWQR